MKKKKLVVVPSDPLKAYEHKSRFLERYYNPTGYFDEVYVLSPREPGNYEAYGMKIYHVLEKDFSKVVRDIKPDVIRAYGGYWPCDLVCKNLVDDIPVVVSVHDTINIFPSIIYADMVLCMSNIVAEKVMALGVDISRIRILPNRIDESIFHPCSNDERIRHIKERFSSECKYILHIGRKAEQKNLDTLIKALTYLPIEYECIFVGRGDSSNYKLLAEKYGVLSRTHWIESIENVELPLWYSWADCFCVISRWEGFGIVFIEAAACGAAIITSDIAPMNEYLEHDESAYLLQNYEEPEETARAITYVCENLEYKEKISKGATQIVKPFERQEVDKMEIGFYQEICSIEKTFLSRNMRHPLNRVIKIKTWKFRQKLSKSIAKRLEKLKRLFN